MQYMANTAQVLKIVGIVLAASAILAYLGYIASNDTGGPTPCSTGGWPARCYAIDEDMCSVVWKKGEDFCSEKIKKLSLPPGRLAGPIQFKCQWAILDKAFLYSRASSPECDQEFKELDGWLTRNGFQ